MDMLREVGELRQAGMAWMALSDEYVRAQQQAKVDGVPPGEIRVIAYQAGDAAMLGKQLLFLADKVEEQGMRRVPIGIA